MTNFYTIQTTNRSLQNNQLSLRSHTSIQAFSAGQQGGGSALSSLVQSMLAHRPNNNTSNWGQQWGANSKNRMNEQYQHHHHNPAGVNQQNKNGNAQNNNNHAKYACPMNDAPKDNHANCNDMKKSQDQEAQAIQNEIGQALRDVLGKHGISTGNSAKEQQLMEMMALLELTEMDDNNNYF